MAGPAVSVCIITGGRLPLLDACLASLQTQAGAPPFELLICSNGGPDVTAAVRARFPEAVVGRLERIHLGAARNFLIARATGEWLLFLDDDVTVRPDMLARLWALAGAHPDAMVLGGPNHTPRGSSRFQIVQGAVLSSIVASGPVRRRYGPHPPGPADERFFTLCNMAVRRSAMEPFPDDLLGAEENAVLTEMSRRGMAMFYDPGLVAFHERRPSLGGFAVQMFKYGRGRGQLMRRRPGTVRLAYLAAPALVLGLPAAGVLASLSRLTLVPVGLYAMAVAAAGARVGWELRSAVDGFLAATLVVVVHLWYGAGTIRGAFDRPRRPAQRPEPRWAPAEQATGEMASGDMAAGEMASDQVPIDR